MRLFFSLLALAANVAVLVALFLLVGARFSPAVAGWRDEVLGAVRGWELWLAFVVALTATLGSLYLSEVVHFEPCKLCWYQRIAMYPLAVIFAMAAVRRDSGVRLYATVLAGIGAAIAGYHYLIQHYPWFDAGSCSVGVPCTAAYIEVFGFITIPYMALSAFLLILMLMAALWLNSRPSPRLPEGRFAVSEESR